MKKLKEFVKSSGEVFRRCDDQFIILLKEYHHATLISMMGQLRQRTKGVILEDGRYIDVDLVLGVYEIPEDEKNMIACISRVDLARFLAKKDKSKGYAFYDQKCMEEFYRRHILAHDLKVALDEDGFEVYLQPKINLNTQKITGAEALVRWKKGNTEQIGPDVFIPVLEHTGLIRRLDTMVFEKVCVWLQKWKKEGSIKVPIAINLSKVYLKDDDFIQKIMDLLRAYEVETRWIELEITESVSLDEGKQVIKIIQKLKDKGFNIAMDDFGAGYSSLNMLMNLPIDVLKLDKGFIQESQTNPKSMIIIKYTVEMAHQLGLKVVAEGIENQEQVDLLMSINCDSVQGYFYAKPMPVEDYEKYLKIQKTN